MSRWEPNAVGRLEEAAMALFQERGYEATTVVDIAERAGLTERTFFRYFPDKREALFSGGKLLEAKFIEELAAASLPPIAAITTTLHAVAGFMQTRPSFEVFARRRQALINAHAELHERELSKLASLTSAIAKSLRQRGVDELAARLAAEAGMAAFRIGFERWVADPKRRALDVHMTETMAALSALFTSSPKRRAPRRA